MTREEAIDILSRPITMKNTPSDILEAHEMAIKALEQEPCGDTISRKEAIKKFTYNYKGKRIPEYDCENLPVQIDIKTIKEILRDLPPVTPKQGQWVKHDTGHSIYYDCSLCGCAAPCTETADSFIWKLSNFCPDCGTEMQEAKNDTNDT